MSETRIVSFVLRFVQQTGTVEAAPGTMLAGQEGGPLPEGWHGVIRHVQTREEIRFTRVDEALRFIDSYLTVPAEEGDRFVAAPPSPGDD